MFVLFFVHYCVSNCMYMYITQLVYVFFVYILYITTLLPPPLSAQLAARWSDKLWVSDGAKQTGWSHVQWPHAVSSLPLHSGRLPSQWAGPSQGRIIQVHTTHHSLLPFYLACMYSTRLMCTFFGTGNFGCQFLFKMRAEQRNTLTHTK